MPSTPRTVCGHRFAAAGRRCAQHFRASQCAQDGSTCSHMDRARQRSIGPIVVDTEPCCGALTLYQHGHVRYPRTYLLLNMYVCMYIHRTQTKGRTPPLGPRQGVPRRGAKSSCQTTGKRAAGVALSEQCRPTGSGEQGVGSHPRRRGRASKGPRPVPHCSVMYVHTVLFGLATFPLRRLHPR